jgi:hypothetical protein
LKWTPSPNYELKILNSFYETNYQLNRGINRPTQALIDNGTYITGIEQFVNPTGRPIGANYPASNLVPTTIPQTRGVVVATGRTQIDRADVIVNPNDSSYAKTDFAQVIQRLRSPRNTTQGLINLNGNLTYQPFSWLTAYLTYDYSTSTTDGQGGGYSIGNDNKFDNPDFRNASDLYEGGFKFDLLDGKLFLAMAGFRQTRSIPRKTPRRCRKLCGVEKPS